MHVVRRWLCAGLMLTGLAGCPGFGDQTLAELEGVEGVTYEGEIKALIEARCFPCHTAPPKFGAPNSLDGYDDAAAFAARMQARAVDEASMPPGAPLPDEDKALISAWVAAGAPQGTPGQDMDAPDLGPGDMAPGDMTPLDMGPMRDMDPDADQGPDGGPMPDIGAPPPTWNDDVQPIMAMWCAFPGCHGGSPSAQLDLSTYAGFVEGGISGDLTGGGDPDDSLFMDRLRARNGFPVMPQGGPMLSDPELQLIEAWITAGHPEG